MIAADLVRATALLTIPIAAVLHRLTMVELYLAAMVVGGASALFDIADHAFLPGLIGKPDLLEGNAKLATTESISEIGGPALAGFLVQLLSAPIAIGFNAISYLASAFLLGSISSGREKARSKDRRPWYRDIRTGFDAIVANPLVRPLFMTAAIAPLFEGFFSALYSVYAIDVLHLSPGLLGAIIGVGGIGALLGASLSPFFARRFGIGPSIVFGFLASAASSFFVPLANGPVALAAGMLILGQLFGDSLALVAMVPAASLRQSVFPSDLLGRTAALFRAASGATAVAGAVIGGVLGERLGVRDTLFISAAGILATTTILLFSPLPKLRSLPGSH